MIPVSYFQTDARWKNVSYSAPGESTTIGKAGCGPTCMAMVIASLKDKKITPKDTCAWALKKGYKALKSGTYYTYFVPQGKAYGIEVERLNTSNIYKQKTAEAEKIRNKAVSELKAGNWIIACMGKGTWTSSGHYVLCYDVDVKKNIIYIKDPASSKTARIKGDLTTWKNEVKYLWKVVIPEDEEDEGEEEVKYYENIKEIPDFGKKVVQKLIDNGCFSDKNNLHLSYDMIRMLVILDRANK